MSTAATPLAKLLPDLTTDVPVRNHFLVRDFTPSPGIYTLVNLGVAVCFELTPVATSHLSVADLKGVTEMVSQALGRLAPKAGITFTTYRSRIIDDDIQAYESFGGEVNPVLSLLRDRHVEQLRRGIDEPLLGNGEDRFMIGKWRTIGCILMHPRKEIGNPINAVTDVFKEISERAMRLFGASSEAKEDGPAMTPQARRFRDAQTELVKELSKTTDRVLTALQGKGFSVRLLEPVPMMQHVVSLLYPRTGHHRPIVYDTMTEIYNQIAIGEVEVAREKGYVKADGVYFRTGSMRLAPRETWPGILSRPNAKFDRSVMDYLDRGHLTIGCIMEDQVECELLANDLLRYSRSELCPEAVKDEVHEEAINALRRIGAGERMLTMTITAVCHGDTPEDAERRISLFCDRMTTIGIPMRVEESEGPRFFFQSLPLNYTPPIKPARRGKLVFDSNVAEMMPVYGYGRGADRLPRAITVIPNRHGEPMRINLSAGGASHGTIMGMTRTGKSVYGLKIMLDFLRQPDAQVFIIDFNNSFGNAIGTMAREGSVNNLGGTNRTTTNVFRGSWSQVSEFAPSFLADLASPDGKPLDGEEIGFLNTVLHRAFQEKRPDPVHFTEFSSILPSPDVFIEYARKRLVAAFVDRDLHQALANLRRRTEGRPVVFDVLYRYVLDEVIAEDGKVVTITAKESIPTQLANFLTVKGCEIEQLDDNPVVILTPQSDYVALFESKGFKVRLDTAHCYIDVEQREDAQEVQGYGVSFIISDAMRSGMVSRELERLRQDQQYANADHAVLAQLASDRTARPSGSEIYDNVTGLAVIQTEVFFSDVGGIIDGYAEAGNELAKRMQSRLGAYYGSGAQSAYFDGPTGFDLKDARIIGFELTDLQYASAHTLATVTSAVLQMIHVHCLSPQMRGRPKMLVIDEAHRLMPLGSVGKHMSTLWRELGKVRTTCLAISQTIEDFATGEWSKVILSQSPNRFSFAQGEQVCDKAEELLGYTPDMVAMLKSVHSVPGYFAEFMWENRAAGICEVGVFLAEPSFYWIATSDGSDVAFRRETITDVRARNPGIPDQEARMIAITTLAENYPNGYFHTKH